MSSMQKIVHLPCYAVFSVEMICCLSVQAWCLPEVQMFLFVGCCMQ